jgi:hypothetical protein
MRGAADQLIPINSACEYFRDEFGRTVHPTTLHRWATRGIRGGVKLSSFVLGGRRFTNQTAIRLFLEACSDSDKP